MHGTVTENRVLGLYWPHPDAGLLCGFAAEPPKPDASTRVIQTLNGAWYTVDQRDVMLLPRHVTAATLSNAIGRA